ncbi:hypothetical protein GCM10022222_59350 [Amycolatopsis ultiminotia]|uniref:Uncharacterized protein n=1 Tax=Amycolatopsis ultiminotia TaxID=543629 RepID=A0ABP6XI09_9PSEU
MLEFSPVVERLRIVVLHVGRERWCASCGLLSATTICYVLEAFDGVPSGLHRFCYCRTCESQDAR